MTICDLNLRGIVAALPRCCDIKRRSCAARDAAPAGLLCMCTCLDCRCAEAVTRMVRSMAVSHVAAERPCRRQRSETAQTSQRRRLRVELRATCF